MSRVLTIPDWLPDLVARHGFTEAEAAAMLRAAFDQVEIAAAVYAAVTTARLRS